MFLLLALGIVAGCGGRTIAVSSDGAGVAKDAQDAHLDRKWSCGSLRAALVRYSPVALNAAGVQAAAAKTCDGAVVTIKVGTSRVAVRGSMGTPEIVSTDRCWFFTWPRSLASPDAGSARICFNNNAVATVQRSLATLN